MSHAAPSFNLSTMSPLEISQFIENGFFILRNAFSSKVADQIAPLVWNEMQEDRNDPSTWTQPLRTVEKVLEDLPIDEILTDRYVQTLNDLCGVGKWETNMGVGYWVNIFPQWPASTIEQRPIRFHIDTRVSPELDAAPLGLAVMEFFSNVDRGGGGTAIQVGSHRYIARVANETGFRLDDDPLVLRASALTEHLPVIQITPRAGDVLLMHPFTVHSSSPNVTTQIRLAANRPVSLFERMNFHRIDPTLYSPIEWAVVNALNEHVL